MRSLPLVFSVFSLGAALASGCGGGEQPSGSSASTSSGTGGAGPPSFCAGKTSFVYDPASQQVDAFPDDFFSVDDESSATGMRVHMVLGDNVVKPASGPTF